MTMNRSNIPHQGLEGGLYIVYIYILILLGDMIPGYTPALDNVQRPPNG